VAGKTIRRHSQQDRTLDIVTRMSDSRRGFGLDIEFTDHLQVVLQITTTLAISTLLQPLVSSAYYSLH
jgi:hypothetical protein